MIEVFNNFSKTLQKPTVVVLDNASFHKSRLFKSNIAKWQKRGLTLLYLPPYSPELNIIEILWKFIKYYWIEFTAFTSYENLVSYVKKVLAGYGSDYLINFGKPMKLLKYVGSIEVKNG